MFMSKCITCYFAFYRKLIVLSPTLTISISFKHFQAFPNLENTTLKFKIVVRNRLLISARQIIVLKHIIRWRATFMHLIINASECMCCVFVAYTDGRAYIEILKTTCHMLLYSPGSQINDYSHTYSTEISSLA